MLQTPEPDCVEALFQHCHRRLFVAVGCAVPDPESLQPTDTGPNHATSIGGAKRSAVSTANTSTDHNSFPVVSANAGAHHNGRTVQTAHPSTLSEAVPAADRGAHHNGRAVSIAHSSTQPDAISAADTRAHNDCSAYRSANQPTDTVTNSRTMLQIDGARLQRRV